MGGGRGFRGGSGGGGSGGGEGAHGDRHGDCHADRLADRHVTAAQVWNLICEAALPSPLPAKPAVKPAAAPRRSASASSLSSAAAAAPADSTEDALPSLADVAAWVRRGGLVQAGDSSLDALVDEAYAAAVERGALRAWTVDDEIDLHGYSVPLARAAVRHVISGARSLVSAAPRPARLVIITGRGKGSSGKVPLVQRALLRMLPNARVAEGNAGRIEVEVDLDHECDAAGLGDAAGETGRQE